MIAAPRQDSGLAYREIRTICVTNSVRFSLMVAADEARFLRSLGSELEAQATRVRDLIGPIHWGTDGAHKETLLRELLIRHLPSGLRCVRGFITLGDGQASTEQDILVIDTHLSAPLFQTQDFAVCFPESVLAAISVKTALGRKEICDVVHGLASIHALCPDIWTGGFFFDDESSVPETATIYSAIKDALNEHQPDRRPLASAAGDIGPDVICTMRSLLFKVDYSRREIQGFSCDGLAPAVLLSKVLGHIDRKRRATNGGISRLLDRFRPDLLTPPSASF